MPARINPLNPYTVTCHASKPLWQTDAEWDELPDDTQGIVSSYVDIERQRRRLLRFSFRASPVAAPHSLQFLRALLQLRTALEQAHPPVLHAGAQRTRATLEQVARVEEQARLLFDTVFQLDAADDVNVQRFEWARVRWRLVQLQFVPGQGHASWLGPHDHGYIAYFRAAREGPAGLAEEPAEGRRTRHQLRVLLPMYAPPPGLENFTHLFNIAGGPAVHLAYMGFLRFSTFNDARGSLRLRREQAAA
jgi:hypothetical protein